MRHQILTVSGVPVATYVIEPDVDKTMAPRPYLHPITTLRGTVVTDAAPEDHRWHLGLSLAVQDVNGTNLWGGRTYVRGQGYTWLDDHGTITHEGFDAVEPGCLAQRLTWRDPDGRPLLAERREISAEPAGDRGWTLTLRWALTATDRVTLGSPTTNGREYGAGYGGCFLRLAPDPDPVVRMGDLTGEETVNGSRGDTLSWSCARYSLKLEGGPRWFVRTGIYPGVCDAWAFEEVKVIEAGQTWHGRFRMTVTDPARVKARVMDVRLLPLDEASLVALLDLAVADAAPDEVMPPMPDHPQWDDARRAAFLRFFRPMLGSSEVAVYAVVAGGAMAGFMRLKRLDAEGRRAETGMWLGRSWRGRGVGAAALDRVLAEAARAGYQIVVADTTPGNAAALGVLRRHGARLASDQDKVVAEIPIAPGYSIDQAK